MKTSSAARISEAAGAEGLPQEIALTDIHNPAILKGLSVWQSACANRPFPARADMTPRIMSDLLRNTVLVRVLPSKADYEFRIIGDAMVQSIGASFQGMTTAEVDLILPGVGSLLKVIYDYTYKGASPVALRGWYHNDDSSRSLFHETLVLPLGNEDQIIDHFLIFAVYAFTPRTEAR